MVPVSQTTLMANALAECEIPFEVHIFENGQHGLSLADQASAEAEEQIYPEVAGWFGLAETWLKKRFALDMPRTCEKWAFEKE